MNVPPSVPEIVALPPSQVADIENVGSSKKTAVTETTDDTGQTPDVV